ncbi:cyclomaltodextrin glucanotransferase precursor, putative [Entamoeba invadens IP1]|uniref:cyclomaltodextrin glucanotransferase precursor, putative n=1 Tax=Entamoeba invadens IP1 TaxID=370355 RepID=UPI0002C3D933|nr:cyclomaltodextrin glucanotransferase precursor, putative [Entamoeba invadens IP1]ELP93406.1 cyclomaltodextrin glucanotransferase precursor, putative [Entamoeba invadens IP1]|eukprot:XP_004260177.1 cyclomaltodextrin glucanotransferase precursor, putative [Entamoeba invadens IP1]
MIALLALLVAAQAIDTNAFNNLRIYQVMVSSFQDGDPNKGYGTGYGPSSHKGDLRGIINALQYIKDLGMNALWMTPVFNSNGGSQLDSTGYFAYDYFNVDPKFGTNDELHELINKAHGLGIYVILDGVFGHHKGGNVAASPSGKYPSGGSDPVSYPGSLDFYKEVATYWINNYEIDGWRLDQAYQVSTRNQDRNYWKDIREAIESTCDSRKGQGKTWGTLGYMVGEIWDSVSNINNWGYYASGGYGLRSCFHFPGRYNLVQTLACEESGKGGYDASNLKGIFDCGYPDYAYPNLFITNHDLLRFGNLIRKKYGYSQGNNDYWGRHKAALAFLAAYSGPITVYYGDEVGDIVDCYYNPGDCGAYNDNAARSDGHISGFNSQQQDLHDYVAKLMKIRAENSALFKGSRQNQNASGALFKVDKVDGSNKVQILINTNNNEYDTQCGSGVDLITGNSYSGTCHMKAFSAIFLKM